MNLLSGIIVLVFVVSACQATLPPAGIYVELSKAEISSLAAQLTTNINNRLKHVGNIKSITGDTNGVSYQFTSFSVSAGLGPFFYTGTEGGTFNFGWTGVHFVINFNYHVSSDSWPHPAESGTVSITTVKPIKAELYTSVNLHTNPPRAVASGAALYFNAGDVNIHTHCTNTICIIPVSKIGDAIAGQFTPQATKALKDGFNEEAAKILKNFKPLLGLPLGKTGNELLLNLDSQFAIEGGNVVIAPKTTLAAVINHHVYSVPFGPNYSLPSSVLAATPSRGLTIYLTSYVFHAALYAIGESGSLNMTITQAKLPPGLPIALSTNDAFFQSAAPGLVNYPNMSITVRTKEVAQPYVGILPSGPSAGISILYGAIRLDFSISNRSASLDAFSFDVYFTMNIRATVGLNSTHLYMPLKLNNSSFTLRPYASNIGPIVLPAFEQLLSLLPAGIKLPTLAFPIPKGVHLSYPTSSYQTGYFVIATNFQMTLPTEVEGEMEGVEDEEVLHQQPLTPTHTAPAPAVNVETADWVVDLYEWLSKSE